VVSYSPPVERKSPRRAEVVAVRAQRKVRRRKVEGGRWKSWSATVTSIKARGKCRSMGCSFPLHCNTVGRWRLEEKVARNNNNRLRLANRYVRMEFRILTPTGPPPVCLPHP
jgi:hypothetical protein